MKIAVLIAGEYREFSIAHKFWKFLHWPNVDVFFATWNKTLHIDKNRNVLPKILNVEDEDILKYVTPKKYKILDYNNKFTKNKSYYNAAMVTLWQEAISLLEQTEEKYDFVILIRPDIAIHYDDVQFNLFLNNIKKNDRDIYLINSFPLHSPQKISQDTKVSDLVIVGTQEAIIKLKKISLEAFNEVENNKLVDIHSFLASQFSTFFDCAYNLPVQDWCIVRSSSHLKYDRTFEEYKKDSKTWWETFYRKFFSTRKNLNHEDAVIDRNIVNTNSINLFDKYDLIDFSNIAKKRLEHNEHLFVRYEKKQNLHKTYDYPVFYKYNSYGFRVPEIGPAEFEESINYPKFLVSGCSNTEGVGLEEHHIWHSFLVDLLSPHVNKPIAKFNVGKGGISAHAAIRHVYVSIEHKNFTPDFVLLMLPPIERHELFCLNENQWSIYHYLPNNQLHMAKNLGLQGLIRAFTENNAQRKFWHEIFRSLLFMKYYLQTKNIPWAFSFWNNDFSSYLHKQKYLAPCEEKDFSFPEELSSNLLNVKLNIDEHLPEKFKIFDINIAKDYLHYGPNSHWYAANQFYDELTQRKEFNDVIKKWNLMI